MNPTRKPFSVELGSVQCKVLSLILFACLLGSQAEAQDASAENTIRR